MSHPLRLFATGSGETGSDGESATTDGEIARAYARHRKAVSNFAALLPSPQSDLAQQTLKDPYIFDFLKPARRPDVVLFVNGLPLGDVELKNAADESATLWSTWQQSQTCKAEIAWLFALSEGVAA